MRKSLMSVMALACAMSLGAQGLGDLQVKKAGIPSKRINPIHMLKGQKVENLNALQALTSNEKVIFKAEDNGSWLNETMIFYPMDVTTGYPEELEFEIQVKPDSQTANKYWFWNLFNVSSATDSVYATLEGNILTFPAGQSFGTVNLTSGNSAPLVLTALKVENGVITDFDLEKEIVVSVDAEKHTLTFPAIVGYLQGLNSYLSGTMFMDDAHAYSLGYAPLNVSYTYPEGLLFYGFSKSGGILNVLRGIGATNTKWEWNAKCSNAVGNVGYEWFSANLLTGDEVSGTGEVFSIDVTTGENYLFPLLFATTEHSDGFWQNGLNLFYNEETGYADALVVAGGQSMEVELKDEQGAVTTEVLNVTNANVDCQYTFEMAMEGTYMFGSGPIPVSETEAMYLDGVASRYEKPGAPLSFAGVDVLCDAYEGGEGKLQLTVVTIKDELDDENGGFFIEDTIAVSDEFVVTDWSEGTSLLSFRNFVERDASGFETEVGRMEFSDKPFALILTGFGYQSGVTIGVASEATYGSENYAYILLGGQNGEFITTSWIDMNTHLFMLLTDAVYGDGISGIAPVESSNTTKLFSTSDAFNFTYTDDFTSVDVYNVNGQKVSTYALPQTGTFSIAKAGLADGVYMFRMNGKTTEVLRAVK